MSELQSLFDAKVQKAYALMKIQPQAEASLQHTFAEGLYARTVVVPADTYVLTKIHKREHVTILLEGDVLVVTPRGGEHLRGPLVFVTKSGTQRVIYTISKTTWTTVHATNATDLDDIEDEVITPFVEDPPCLL